MTMKVRRGISPHDISIFCKRASRITLSQIVDNVVVHEQLQVEGEARRTHFTVNITFYPKHEYQEEHDLQPTEILAAFGVKFPLTLRKEVVNEIKRLDADLKSQMAQLGQGKKVRSREGEGDEDEDEDNETSRKKDTDQESEAGVGDADEEKDSKQMKQQATYDSDEEDNGEEDKLNDDDALEAADASDDDGLVGDEASLKKLKSTSFKSLVDRVSGLFQRYFQQAIAFDFDESQCTFKLEVSVLQARRVVRFKSFVQFMSDMPKLLFVGIVERACRATVIREIPGIADCFQTKGDSQEGSAPEIKVITIILSNTAIRAHADSSS